MAYMDNMVVFSHKFKEHLHHLAIILAKMKLTGLTIIPSKVQLASRRINLHEYVVNSGTITPSNEKLKEYPVPGNIKVLQHLLGAVGFLQTTYTALCTVLAVS